MRLDLRRTRSIAAQHALDIGCRVDFTRAPLLSSTYPLKGADFDQIGAAARDAAAGLGLPAGLAAMIIYDCHHVGRLLDAEQVKALYMALRDHVAAINHYDAWLAADLPAMPVVIA